MSKKTTSITPFSTHLDKARGKRGQPARESFEAQYESFKLGVLLQQKRIEQGLTQQQLANKCGTTKNYISRIENDASDIRLSTLTRIVSKGLGAALRLTISD